jgi:hypothetical protein
MEGDVMQTHWAEGGELAVMGVRGEDSARAVLYGAGVSGESWASVPCRAELAEGGARITFLRPGDPLSEFDPVFADAFRIWSRGKLLRECTIEDRTWTILPGDSLTIHVPPRVR